MPIIVKDYVWEESETMVYITVPLKGVKAHKVDIFSVEDYVKVSYPPYMFECFLKAPVYDQKSAAQIGNGEVILKLEKHEKAIWTQLQHPSITNKLWQIEVRDKAVLQSQQRAEEEKKMRDKVKDELKRYGVNQQIKLEDTDRKRIEKIKDDERTKAMEDLEKWKEHQQNLSLENQKKEEIEKKAQEEERRAAKKKEKSRLRSKKANIFQEEAGENPIRQTQKIDVSFTPRVFPTPLRESVAGDEQEWLKKQAEAKRTIDIKDADLTEEEKNPIYLKEKADKFFKSGDLHSAISAYTIAIRFSPKLPALFSNRAACHLKLGNLMKCAEDSDQALKLLTPAVAANAASRMKAHVRRGTALIQLQLYAEGLQDYEVALKIDPTNEQLQADSERVREIIQSSDPDGPDVKQANWVKQEFTI